MLRKTVLILLPMFLLTAFQHRPQPEVRLGIDRLVKEYSHLVEGKRVGLITNPTGLAGDLQTSIDLLHGAERIELTALFGPEHGVRGDIKGGIKIENFQDAKTSIPVYSLYGKTHKPTAEMLADVDVLLFDLQDIGIRPYTYIYTMARAMEAAKEYSIQFVVLDRPNPMGGTLVGGPVLEPEFASGIGLYPIPYVHGMTVGELAILFNEEFGINCRLTVVPMENWRRDMLFAETGLMWVPTSPHVPRPESCFYMASTGGFGELWSLSEGVGTPLPFELCGAPWIDGERLADAMNELGLPGVYFRPLYFRPYYLRFVNEQCGGVQIHITDFAKYRPLTVAMHLLATVRDLFPEQDFFQQSTRTLSFDRAFGTDRVRKDLMAGKSATEILAGWEQELEEFGEMRERYLIYE
jgi:uncharacterized protein YbbC (DUF1343 family)